MYTTTCLFLVNTHQAQHVTTVPIAAVMSDTVYHALTVRLLDLTLQPDGCRPHTVASERL